MSKNLFASLLLSVVGFSAQAAIPSGMMCGQVIVRMYNAETKEFKMANNTCVAAELKMAGFTAVTSEFNPETQPVEKKRALPLLTVIKSGKYQLTDSGVACEAGKVCVPNTRAVLAKSKLVLKLPLVGCLDSAFVTYKISDDQNTGVKTVLVSALNVRNEASDSARCIAAPTATKTIELKQSITDKSLLKLEFVQDIAR